MPKKLISCVRQVQAKIRQGKQPKTYTKGGKRMKSNPYAICAASQLKQYKPLKRTDKAGRKLYKSKSGAKFYVRQGKKVYVK